MTKSDNKQKGLTYAQSLKLEYRRIRSSENSKRGKFQSGLLSLDCVSANGGNGGAVVGSTWAHDGGKGMSQVRNSGLTAGHAHARMKRRIRSARMRVFHADKRLLPFFDLFVKHDGRKTDVLDDLIVLQLREMLRRRIAKASRAKRAKRGSVIDLSDAGLCQVYNAAKRRMWKYYKKISKILKGL